MSSGVGWAVDLTMAFSKYVIRRAFGVGSMLALAGLVASGCALTAPEPGGTVHVADIINSVKCGLAEALQSEAGRRRLPGTIAQVELQLKVVDARSLGVNSPSTATPLVLGWFGPAVLPTLSGSNQQSFTVDTIIDLSYRLDAPNITACTAAGVDREDKFGFARWLGDIIAGLSKVSANGPKGSLDRLVYDANFAVTRSGSIGGSVQVVFLSASASADRSRADTQHLRIVISNSNAASGIATNAVDGAPVARGVPLKQVGPIPSLSASPPAQR